MDVAQIIGMLPDKFKPHAVAYIDYSNDEPISTSASAAKWYPITDEPIGHFHDMRRASRVNLMTWRGPFIRDKCGVCVLLAIPAQRSKVSSR